MTERTFNIRKAELLRDVNKHPHKDELVNIMLQQLQDDINTYKVCTTNSSVF